MTIEQVGNLAIWILVAGAVLSFDPMWLIRPLRRAGIMRRPTISSDEALAKVKNECVHRGFECNDQRITVEEELRHYRVVQRPLGRSRFPLIAKVDLFSGAITELSIYGKQQAIDNGV